MLRYLYLIFGLALCSCSSMCSYEMRRATCNELRSKIVFNGATSNTRQAEIERAEMPLDQCTYNSNYCDYY